MASKLCALADGEAAADDMPELRRHLRGCRASARRGRGKRPRRRIGGLALIRERLGAGADVRTRPQGAGADRGGNGSQDGGRRGVDRGAGRRRRRCGQVTRVARAG
jgi:hypothetical protein